MAEYPAHAPGRRDLLLWLAIGAALLSLVLHFAPFGSTRDTDVTAMDAGGGSSGSAAALSSIDSQDRLRELERRLEEESEKRRRLEDRLAALTLEPAGALEPQGSDPGPIATEPAAALPAAGPATGRQVGLDESVLIEAGFSASDARDLRRAFDEIQMEQLYIADEAAREGLSPREARADAVARLAEREQELLRDYGDEAYDWLLYASGRPNQVSVRQIFGESPAAAAGLQQGDVVLRYGDQRVRNGRDLKEATTRGQSGEWVDVQYLRNGAIETVRVPRGPLGIVLNVLSAPPVSGSG